MSQNIDVASLKKQLTHTARLLNSYRNFIFFLVLTALYGFLVLRINVLSTASPSVEDIKSAQQTVPRQKIPDKTIQKLNSLQDNSVRVQSLFNEARQNPFQ